MASPDHLPAGACFDLPLPIVDKYFAANGNTERFLSRTARAICGGCAIRLTCLTDAIKAPLRYGVRGGETATVLKRMSYIHRSQGVPAEELAAAAIAKQKPLGGVEGLRRGHFGNEVLGVNNNQ